MGPMHCRGYLTVTRNVDEASLEELSGFTLIYSIAQKSVKEVASIHRRNMCNYMYVDNMHRVVATCHTNPAKPCSLIEKTMKTHTKKTLSLPTPNKKPKLQWAAISLHGESSYSLCLFPRLLDHDFQK